MYSTVIVGIDQSYQNTGISIVADGKLKDVKSIHLDKCKTNSERRGALRLQLSSLMDVVTVKANKVVCIIERIRLHSGTKQSFIDIDYIKSIGALNACIVDVCALYGVEVFSVDTRCWKSQVIGTSKPLSNKFGVPDEKWPTVQWVISNGFGRKILVELPENSRKQKGTFTHNGKKYMYNNDAADSAGIAMFGVLGDQSKLTSER